MKTCDKNGRPIEVGDVLEVSHCAGARNKKHFMYKQVVGINTLGGTKFFLISHLNMKPAAAQDGGYWMGMQEGTLEKYEIVQAAEGAHENRPKLKLEEQP